MHVYAVLFFCSLHRGWLRAAITGCVSFFMGVLLQDAKVWLPLVEQCRTTVQLDICRKYSLKSTPNAHNCGPVMAFFTVAHVGILGAHADNICHAEKVPPQHLHMAAGQNQWYHGRCTTHLAMVQHQWYHFGIGAPPILLIFSGDWDVDRGYGILTRGCITKKHILVARKCY